MIKSPKNRPWAILASWRFSPLAGVFQQPARANAVSKRQVCQGFAGDAKEAPFVEGARAEGLVEADGGLVPAEHRPLEAPAAALERDPRDGPQKVSAVAASPIAGQDEKILEVHPGSGEERRVVVKEEREPDDAPAAGPVVLGDERLAVAAVAEEVFAQLLVRSHVRVLQPFVARELVDESVQGGHVRGQTRANHGLSPTAPL